MILQDHHLPTINTACKVRDIQCCPKSSTRVTLLSIHNDLSRAVEGSGTAKRASRGKGFTKR